jgi:glycosyltransferase involved in cell wall biosynthesis
MAEPSILILSHSLASGGTERQVAETAKALARLGWDVHVGCFHASGTRREELIRENVRLVEFPVRTFRNPLHVLQCGIGFVRYIRENRIRLVHSFDYPTAMFGAPAAKLGRCPVLLTSQRSYRTLNQKRDLPFIRFSDKLADGIVVNCDAVRRHLIEDEGIAPGAIRLCYNGLNTDKFTPAGRDRARVPALQDAIVVGTVCVLREEKDLPTLVDAFAVASWRVSKLRLAVVGSGPLLSSLQEQAGRLGVADKILFQSDTPDVTPWLQQMDVFVLPSKSEALSNALMEAMACGAAPVASRVGGNPELVGDRGLLFEAGNAAQLAGHLITLAESPELRQQYASSAAEFIRFKLSVEVAGRRMAEIYTEFLERAGVKPSSPGSANGHPLN